MHVYPWHNEKPLNIPAMCSYGTHLVWWHTSHGYFTCDCFTHGYSMHGYYMHGLMTISYTSGYYVYMH